MSVVHDAWERIKFWANERLPAHADDFFRVVLIALNDARMRLETIEEVTRAQDAVIERGGKKYRLEWSRHSDQELIADWIRAVLSEESATNAPERSLRLAEEALELTQALGVDKDSLHKLVDYVYSRPPGKPEQEIAGCLVTLYGVASALRVSAQQAFDAEYIRISQPEVMDRVRRRQAEKRVVTKT